ncbi:TPA: hypothetical protein ACVPFL_001826 [Morganella morganii]
MYSYSFAVKLINCQIDKSCMNESFNCSGQLIKIEQKEGGVLLVSSDGYSCKEEASEQLANMLMKIKVILLKQKVPHFDWFSVDEAQRIATSIIGNLFEKSNIVAVSYKPQVYETKKFQHWPNEQPFSKKFSLNMLNDISLPEEEGQRSNLRSLEALNVLGLALTDPHAKSKLILAMTAIEVLIDRVDVEKDILDALDSLNKKIPEVDASSEVKELLSKILKDAKTESISKAGKRLVKRLFNGSKAKKFYNLYNIRSELVHGNSDRFSIVLSEQGKIEEYAKDAYTLALDVILKYRNECK